MKCTSRHKLAPGVIIGSTMMCAAVSPVYAQSLNDAITGGKVGGVLNLRFEDVSQDNALEDASVLTLRSAVSYTTGDFQGFSAMLEMEDVRAVFGQDEYTVGPSGFNPGIYSVIADPETTELNQGFLQYTRGAFTAKVGRQVITHDAHRFIGSVPWRQDWQTYDAATATYKVNEKLDLGYSYIDNRERIFAEDADIDSADHVLRAAYATPYGSLAGYAYLLENEDLPVSNSLDTYGIRFSGSHKVGGIPVSYLAEYASQESDTGAVGFEADYLMLEGGLTWSGITAKLGYELLGSDNGAYGFATPLATLHAFNGWADLFLNTPATGLEDRYLNLSGKLLGGTLTAVLHEFDADDANPGMNDLGSEVDIQFVRPIATHYTLGLKYADFNAGDIAPDTRKLWFWFQARF